MVDRDPPDHLRGNTEELGAVLPVHMTLIDQTQPDFGHQSGTLQRMLPAFSP